MGDVSFHLDGRTFTFEQPLPKRLRSAFSQCVNAAADLTDLDRATVTAGRARGSVHIHDRGHASIAQCYGPAGLLLPRRRAEHHCAASLSCGALLGPFLVSRASP